MEKFNFISFIFSLLSFISSLLVFKYLIKTGKNTTYVVGILMFSIYLAIEVVESAFQPLGLPHSYLVLAKSFFILLGLVSLVFAYYPTCTPERES